MPQFDFDTITDVILHVRYTAREGGDILKAAAIKNLQKKIQDAETVGSVRLFSVRHEFPNDWAKFRSFTIGNLSGQSPAAALTLALRAEHYPFWANSSGLNGANLVKSVELVAKMPVDDRTATINLYDKPDMSGNKDALARNPLMGNLLDGNLNKIPRPAAITDAGHPPLTLYFDNNTMEELWVAITWGKG